MWLKKSSKLRKIVYMVSWNLRCLGYITKDLTYWIGVEWGK